jgi:hypothetical protein
MYWDTKMRMYMSSLENLNMAMNFSKYRGDPRIRRILMEPSL